MQTITITAVGHPTVFTYANRVDAGIHARILESVGYTVIVRDTGGPVDYSDRAIALREEDMSDHETYRSSAR